MAQKFRLTSSNSLLAIEQNFDEKLDKIAQYFINYFGEQYRDLIVNRLNDAIYIFAENSPEMFNAAEMPFEIRCKIYEKINELVFNEFYKEINFTPNPDYIYRFDENAIEFLSLTTADLNKHFKEKKQNLSIVKTIYEIFDNGKNFKNFKEFVIYLKKDDNLAKFQQKIKPLYTKYFQKFAPMREGLSEDEVLKPPSTDTFNIAKRNISFLSATIKFLKYSGMDIDFFDYNDYECLSYFLTTKLEFFADEDKPKLALILKKLFNNDKYKNFSYDDFLNNEETKTLLTSFKKYYSELLERKTSILNQAKVELNIFEDLKNYLFKRFKNSDKTYEGLQKTINEKSIDYFIFKLKNFMSQNSTVEAFVQSPAGISCCVLPISASTPTSVHEMIHIISCELEKHKTGIYKDLKFNRLNEIITEFFALDIYKNMQTDKFEINKSFYYSSAYKNAVDLLTPFIKKHKDILIKAFMGEDITPLIDLIGEKNLTDLDDVCDLLIKYSEGLNNIDDYWKRLQKGEDPEIYTFVEIKDTLHKLRDVLVNIEQSISQKNATVSV